MKKFFKSYLDLILMASALIMAGLLLWLFLETSAQIAIYFSQAVSAGGSGPGGNTAFKVVEAGQLNYRGLANPSSEPIRVPVPPPAQAEVVVPRSVPTSTAPIIP